MRADVDFVALESTATRKCLDQLAREARGDRPLSTYRLQFRREFRFQDAIRIVPYLAQLGVSHVYSSPILRARAGSTHGYDIVNHNELNPEIGTEQDFREFVSALHEHGMGLLLDIVPNHMGVGRGDNPWWQDVLENGPAAEHAEFFDIDWEPLKRELSGKVLLPVLAHQYGRELEDGRMQLEYDGTQFLIRYYESVFPIDPQTAPLIFAGQKLPAELEALLKQLAELPPHAATDPTSVVRRRGEAPLLKQRLPNLMRTAPPARWALDAAIRRMNGRPRDPQSFDGLHRLLEAQAYRLAHWRVSAEEINYRRFFDVNELVGLRMENPKVFAETHQLIRRLLADGSVSGLRVDHPDGMLNPRQYFTRLQMLYCASQCSGATPRPPLADNGIEEEIQAAFGQHERLRAQPPLYVVVEKVLEVGEPLPTEWPVDGTSGYDFLHLMNGAFIQEKNAAAFTQIYERFLETPTSFDEQLYDAKKNIMHTALAGEVNVLAHLLDEISSHDRHARDFTRKALRDAIRETIACLPIYRTYIDERGEINERDRRFILHAIRRAKRRNSSMPAAVFDFLQDILLLNGPPEQRSQQLFFTLKFQQLTGPVMAKSLEDTVCYTYNRFVSVNEVGASPREFGLSLDEFHHGNARRAEQWPHSMLASSTHDTKRSEDVRARLNVLSEMPREWSRRVMRWKRSNERTRGRLADGRIAPDRNEEFLLYQTLVGTWPFDIMLADEGPREAYIGRISDYIEKALHEAKVNLSWINPDPEYVAAVREFIRQVLSPGQRGRMSFFRRDLHELLPAIQFFGVINSLAQTLLKITAPGVPDIYQGNETFEFRLVDPDNRVPVGLAERLQAQGRLRPQSPTEHRALCAEMLTLHADGRAKLWTTMRALCFRRDHPDLFRAGEYVPLHATGERAEHIIAFLRRRGGEIAITAVPRFSHTLMRGRAVPPLGEVWGNTELLLPPMADEVLEERMSGAAVPISPQGTVRCRDMFSVFPVALLSNC